jgi:Protein of unknown function (DUF3500)
MAIDLSPANQLSRRSLVAGGAALLAAVPTVSADAATAASLTTRAADFLASLDGAKRTAATAKWDSSQWRNWNYFGASGYVKPGLRLEQMSAQQKDAAWAIFADVLSPAGLEKARNVMLLQDVLTAAGDGAGQRSRERFSVTVFGTPAAIGRWGLRLEGHHLSLSFAVRDGAIVSLTPAAFAAKPARVGAGPHKGLETIRGEETLARRLMADLSPKLQAVARVQDSRLFNILSTAGSERDNAKKVGLPIAAMNPPQQDLLWQLIETYAVVPYSRPLAERQQARIRSGDASAVHLAWYGPNIAETAFGYRILGDAFVIELGSIDGEAQHLHPVYHDLGNVLGREG